jgi:hypothetical protein
MKYYRTSIRILLVDTEDTEEGSVSFLTSFALHLQKMTHASGAVVPKFQDFGTCRVCEKQYRFGGRQSLAMQILLRKPSGVSCFWNQQFLYILFSKNDYLQYIFGFC